jgi:hypothetical protein
MLKSLLNNRILIITVKGWNGLDRLLRILSVASA